MMDIENFDWGTSNDWYKSYIGNEVFNEKIYEKFFSVEENDIVLDVGASIGIFTYSILHKNPYHVYCFEPSTEQFMTLVRNTTKGFVTCINKGISDIDGSKILNDVYGSENRPSEVYTMRFKTFIDKFNIKKIDFLKTDCEGGEYEIFSNENIWWIKENTKKITGEWHLESIEQKEQFRQFRDIYLKLFPNHEVYSIDGVNIKWDLWNEHFIEHYNQVILYIYNGR